MRATSASGRWLFGPTVDLALGCGGAYAVVFALLWLAPDTVQSAMPIGLIPLLVLVTGIPHYGATLLRVYEQRGERAKYRFFALWATVAVYAWFVVGVYDVMIGSLLLTLYFTWSPWHYTGQNYGLAVMFLGRRGVRVDALTKRLVYASFVLSYALVFIRTHAAVDGGGYAPVSIVGNTYQLVRLGVPAVAVDVLLPLIGVAYAAVIGAALYRLQRETNWRNLGPTLALLALQAVWFTLPILAHASGWFGDGPFSLSLAAYGLLWIAIGHAVQYLWVTAYYALASDRGERRTGYLLKTLLAGAAVWGVPTFVFAPDLLGVRAFDAGLGLLVASAVNVHHFILDGAIWKLRDGRIARILIQRQATDERPAPVGPGHWGGRGVRALIATAGIAYVVTTVVGTLEAEFGVSRVLDPPDYERMRIAAERLRWIGRDNPSVRYDLGMEALRQGELDTARRELTRSVALRENALSWIGLGSVAERGKQWQEGLAAYESALDVDPNNVDALDGSARVLIRLGQPERARTALQRALSLDPDNARVRSRLQLLRSASS